MKSPSVFVLAATAAAATVFLAEPVTAGTRAYMTAPMPRKITDKYKAECFGGLKNLDNNSLAQMSIKELLAKKQTDNGGAETFNLENGCRGTVVESASPHKFTAGSSTLVKWSVESPQNGIVEIRVVEKTTTAKKVEEYTNTLMTVKPPIGSQAASGSMNMTIPDTKGTCTTAGSCVLQWVLKAGDDTYVSCADITISPPETSAPETPAPTTPKPTEKKEEEKETQTPSPSDQTKLKLIEAAREAQAQKHTK